MPIHHYLQRGSSPRRRNSNLPAQVSTAPESSSLQSKNSTTYSNYLRSRTVHCPDVDSGGAICKAWISTEYSVGTRPYGRPVKLHKPPDEHSMGNSSTSIIHQLFPPPFPAFPLSLSQFGVASFAFCFAQLPSDRLLSAHSSLFLPVSLCRCPQLRRLRCRAPLAFFEPHRLRA